MLIVKLVGLSFVFSSVIVVEYGFLFVEYGVFSMWIMWLGIVVSCLVVSCVSVVNVLWLWKNYVFGMMNSLISVCCLLVDVLSCC